MFTGYDFSKITTLCLSNNKLTSLPENIFRPFTNLHTLDISRNKLTSLPENIFRPFANLHTLNIGINKLTSLPENIFASLSNLRTLDLQCNKLNVLPDCIFASLINLELLMLSQNELTFLPKNIFASLGNLTGLLLEINHIIILPDDIFVPLVELQVLYLSNNKLTILPSSILNCRYMHTFFYKGNEITLDIRFRRFIERMQNYDNHDIFSDSQNIHAPSIQASTKQSINVLFKDSFDCYKDDIIKECLTWDIYCLPDLLTYLDDKDVHSTLLVSFYDVFVKVFGRIMSHPNKMDIISRLDEELKESECKCFTGRLTRLVNCLVGFCDDITIGISNSERISAIILSTLDGREMDDELKKLCTDKLKAIDIADDEINKWLS
jgi:Leucine-rich repeat (LRR) protein